MSAMIVTLLLAAISILAAFRFTENHRDVAATYWMTSVAIILTLFVEKGWLKAQ